MKKFCTLIILVCIAGYTLALSSCSGKAATKTIELIEKAASKSGKAAKKVGRYGDDIYRDVPGLRRGGYDYHV